MPKVSRVTELLKGNNLYSTYRLLIVVLIIKIPLFLSIDCSINNLFGLVKTVNSLLGNGNLSSFFYLLLILMMTTSILLFFYSFFKKEMSNIINFMSTTLLTGFFHNLFFIIFSQGRGTTS